MGNNRRGTFWTGRCKVVVLPLVLLGYQGAGEGWPVFNESNPEQVIKLWRSLVGANLKRMSTMERRLMYPLRLQA